MQKRIQRRRRWGGALAAGGEIGDFRLITVGGAIALGSRTSITTTTIDSSADAFADADAFSEAATVTSGEIGNVTLTTTGGTIDLSSTGSVTTSSLVSSAGSSANANARDNRLIGNQITTATSGTIDLVGLREGVTLRDGSSITTNVLGGDGDGGDIQISGASVRLFNNLLTTTVTGEGDAGDITIDVTGDATISGSRLLTGRESGSDGTGAGGRIAITASSIELTDFSFLNTATFGAGNAGNVFLETTEGDISLNNSSIFSLTAGQGSPGNISIDAARVLRLEGNSLISTSVALGVPSTPSSVPGNITVNAANGVEIIGIGVVDQPTQPGTNPNLASISADTIATAQSINNSFALVNAPQDDPNVLLPNEVPYVAISANNSFVCESECNEPGEEITNSDFYSVEVTAAGTQVTFDVDNTATTLATGTLDVDLYLYDGEGNLIDSNASASISLGADGSTTINDAFLSYIFNEPGTYFIEARSSHISADGDEYAAQGNYTLNVSRVDDFLVSSGITTQTRSGIPSGDITINAPTINIQNGGQISAETLQDGQAGTIEIHTGEFVMRNGAEVTTASTNVGDGGNIFIRADNFMRLSNATILAESNPINEDGTLSTTTPGDAGRIQVTTPQLFLRNSARISASNVLSNSEGIRLQGLDLLRLGGGSEISTSTRSGRAGNLSILMADGGDIELSDGSRIAAEVTRRRATATGRIPTAGNLTIRGDRLTVQENSEITVSAPFGQAGTLGITAREIRLNNGRIVAETGFSPENGQGANIQLEALDLLLMRNGSLISARALRDADGGNLTIDAANGFIIAVPFENNDIIATAERGTGGNIEVRAIRLFGFSDLSTERLTFAQIRGNETSDISASSEFGAQGVVTFDTLSIDPSQGLSELPITLEDASQQIAPGCGLGSNPDEDENEFIVTGSGGLPPSSSDPIAAGSVEVPWVVADDAAPVAEAVGLGTTAMETPLVEAQGIHVDAEGNVHLITEVEADWTTNPRAIANQFCEVSSQP